MSLPVAPTTTKCLWSCVKKSLPVAPTTTKCLWSCVKNANISAEAKQKVDEEVKDLFKELITIGEADVGHLNNPSFKKLVEWLSDPCRTVEEFNYVLYELAHTLYEDIEGIEKNELVCIYKDTECPVYLGKVAAEALAARRPLVEGSWELAAWAVLNLTDSYDPYKFGYASDSLGEWIMNMISDPSLCPNSTLRLKFVNQLKSMVQQQSQ